MRISVVIPCFNAAAYLGEALESAFRQSPAPHEVIVVDDGSTDGSADVVRHFPRSIRYVRQENLGISHTRNHAVRLVEGDLVAFLDADDVWTADSLANRYAILAPDPGVDGAVGLVEQFISPELPDAVRREVACPPGAAVARLAGAMLLRRAVFDRVGPFDASFRVGETIDWVARADAAGVVIRTVDRVVLRRRIHETNTGRREAALRSDYLRVLKASLDRRRGSPTDGTR